MNSKKLALVFLVLGLMALVLVLGFFWGKNLGVSEGKNETEKELKPLVDLAFPKPPEEIRAIGGIIKEIANSKIVLEAIDPDDYLPHLDGTPQRRELRSVSITSETKINLVDYTKRDARGISPLIKPLKISELKVGDAVNVRSVSNVRESQQFDASVIEVIRY